MTIDFIFEWNDFSWCPTTTYVKYFKKIKELRPDIEFNFVNAVEKREEARDKTYFGHASMYGPFYCMIKNRANNKYILISYWDSIKDIFESRFSHFDLSSMVELITSIGVTVNDIEFRPISYLKYTPFGYISLSPENERVAEDLVKLDIAKINPDRPKFRNFPNDPFRQFIMADKRFDGIDRRDNNLSIREYMEELNASKINLNINGHGEICHRDMEVLALGNVLLRPKFVVQFHEPLIPDFHYIAVDFNNYRDYQTTADKLINKYNEVKDNKELLDFIGKNAREWYLRNGCTDGNADLLVKLIDFKKLE